MIKKILKVLFTAFSLASGLIVTLVLLLDWKEEWLYEKFGKEKVLKFMKKFEPFISMQPDNGTEEVTEETDEEEEELEEAFEDKVDELQVVEQ